MCVSLTFTSAGTLSFFLSPAQLFTSCSVNDSALPIQKNENRSKSIFLKVSKSVPYNWLEGIFICVNISKFAIFCHFTNNSSVFQYCLMKNSFPQNELNWAAFATLLWRYDPEHSKLRTNNKVCRETFSFGKQKRKQKLYYFWYK